MKLNKRQKEIFGIILIFLSIMSMVSLFGHDFSDTTIQNTTEFKVNNPLGITGVYLSYYLFYILGYPSIVFPVIFFIIGINVFRNKSIKKNSNLILYIFLFGLWISLCISYYASLGDPAPGISNFTENSYLYNQSGLVGFSLFIYLRHFLGFIGITFFLLLYILILLTSFFKISFNDLFNKISLFLNFIFNGTKTGFIYILNSIKKIRNNKAHKEDCDSFIETDIKERFLDEQDNSITENDLEEENNFSKDDFMEKNNLIDDDSSSNNIEIDNVESSETEELVEDEMLIEEEEQIEFGDIDKHQKQNTKYFDYKLPKIDYLNNPIEVAKQSEDQLREKGKELEYALKTFGVVGEVVQISPGPIISLFKVVPAEGVRVNKFTNLSDDIARYMKAEKVRIIAPIPGSRAVGIELPNENSDIVYLRSILTSTRYIESESKLTIALGKTTSGDAYTFDLCKMPHLLIAGATGAGKSVCINTIILSILYKAKPDEVKFILIDPKKIELSTYKSLVGYHLITASNLDEYVMTTAENSVSALSSAINEMERRFQVFSDARVRNIQEYHIKSKNDKSLENIPYIVVLIDELADLMMTSGRAIEEPITRLAQKARAVGIHLVVATQRPSVDVITGLIKSNFPSRISFLVSSKIDSRTILDQMGAEKLLGRGDMLFLLPGSSSPLRVHNAYVTLDEIEKVMKHILSQPRPDEIKLPESQQKKQDIDFQLEDQDELLQDAARLVIEHQQASVSMLQRKFRIGYSRAGRLIDELESLGIISGYSGSKAREVLVDLSYLDEIFS